MTDDNSSQKGTNPDREKGESQYEDWPRDKLMKKAKGAGIKNTSGMSKEELVSALADQ